MSVIKKGTDFGPNEQVTSTKLDDLVDNASFTDTSANAVAYTGSTGTCLNGGGLEVTSAGQLQIKDADIGTAKLADDAVTPAKTDFIDSTSVLTLTGTAPTLKFDDTNNVVTNKPFLSGNTTDGGIDIRTQEGSSNVRVQAVDKLLVRTTSSPSSDNTDVSNYVDRLEVGNTSAKNQDGTAAAGAKVTGGLYATGDVYADDHLVADYLLLQGSAPSITFNDDDNTGTSPRISCNSDFGNMLLFAEKSGADITIDADSEVLLKHDGTIGLTVSALAGKNAAGADAAGAKVSGHLRVTQDIHCSGDYNNINIKGTDPKISLERGNVTTAPVVKGYENGSIEILTQDAGSDVILDAKDGVILQYDNNTVLRTGPTAGKNASGTLVPGFRTDGSIQVTDDVNVAGTMRAATIQIGADNILDLMHPIGSVISTTTNYADSAAVAAKYGGTTWVRFSEGRALTGYSTTDSTFSAGAEGGDKTKSKTIAVNELPKHKHRTPLRNSGMNNNFGFASSPTITSFIESQETSTQSPLTDDEIYNSSNSQQTQQAMSLDVLQPYKVVYMWTRTA